MVIGFHSPFSTLIFCFLSLQKMKSHEWPKSGTLRTMKTASKRFLKLWNIAKVCIQIQMVRLNSLLHVHFPNSIKIRSFDSYLVADFSEEEDEFIMAEDNNHEGDGANGDDDIDQEDIRNLHIDGNFISQNISCVCILWFLDLNRWDLHFKTYLDYLVEAYDRLILSIFTN